jgi:ubiquinone/menaquinone biosynthesis C-methylase UbiE
MCGGEVSCLVRLNRPQDELEIRNMQEFPQEVTRRTVRWLYDNTLAKLSLMFWTQFTAGYYGLEFLKSVSYPVTPSGRGLSKPINLRKLTKVGYIKGQDILLIGIGNGNEIFEWLRYKPNTISALELQNYRKQWRAVTENAKTNIAKPACIQADATILPFKDNSFDFAASFTVLEHILDLESHMAEVNRVLRAGGCYYVVFGPLWPCYGGAHIGSLEYKHLLVNEKELHDLAKSSQDGEIEWLEAGLLNRLKYEEYMRVIKKHFTLAKEAWIISKEGLKFRNKSPDVWNVLRTRYQEKDLLIKTLIIFLEKLERHK